MGNYKKITAFSLDKLNNAEYLSFMNRTLNLLPKESERPEEISTLSSGGVAELGLTGPFLDTFGKDLLELADVVNESRAAQETSELAALDKNRDSLVVYITTRVSRSGSLPMAAEREAGNYLHNVIKPYVSIQKAPNEQETEKIRGLLIDLKKAENSAHVKTLGLEAYLAELEKANEAYDSLSRQRTFARAKARTEFSDPLRERIDGYYDDLAMLSQSYNVVQPSVTSEQFVSGLNQLISEVLAAYNLRTGLAAANKVKKEAGKPTA